MSRRTTCLAALAAVAVLSGCGGPAGGQAGAPPPPEVGVVEIAPQALETTMEVSGRISAFQVSEVRPQIGGIVRSRRFEEGAFVRAGQLLYEIDPGPTRTELAGAEAAATSARSRYERLQGLVDVGAVSRQDVDDARAAADQAAATLEAARINASYTRVTAPISGVIGGSSVTAGALATPAQATPFAVIQQIDRVYVDMTQSSAAMMRLRQAMARNGSRSARVTLILQDGSEYPTEGALQFADVTVDPETGTVRLRALFPNPNQLLLPGMFVQARVNTGTNPAAILAPQQGVTRNARGEAVALVLNQQNVVEQRVLETDGAAGDQWIVVSGLNAGDRLIVEGVQRVQPGSPATAAAPTEPPPQPAQEGSNAGELRGREG